MQILTYDQVKDMLPERPEDAHKGDCGRILLLCGSRGYTGAAALAAMGALRSGAGLVYLGVPECIYIIEAIKLTEPIVFPLPDQDGMLSYDAEKMILQLISKMDAVLVGPGLGQSAAVESVVCTVLEKFNGPVVLDADGINVMVRHKDIIRSRTNSTILTPHPGEYRRLCCGRDQTPQDMAMELGAIVVLKGHKTLITDGVITYQNPTGNAGMAVGGSGDVLSGIITAFLGQGMKPMDAAACGVFIHGAAGDICRDEFGQMSMLPTDMLDVLPRLLK